MKSLFPLLIFIKPQKPCFYRAVDFLASDSQKMNTLGMFEWPEKSFGLCCFPPGQQTGQRQMRKVKGVRSKSGGVRGLVGCEVSWWSSRGGRGAAERHN